jgi:glycosyltransferase involved in cell wall biosynthesis
MTRLVFVTQTADLRNPVVAPTLAKIRALAKLVDELVVLAASVDPSALPENCHAHEFGARTQAARGARYGAALAPELARRPLAVLCHMSPVFALLAAPIAKPLRVPVLLWFTQQAAGRKLALAERLVDAILSVDERSVPLRSAKVRAIGHGIDVSALPCLPAREPPLRRLLGLGRYAPAKGWETAVRALDELPEATLRIHGPVLTARDREHRPELERLAERLGVAQRVQFGREVPHGEVPGLLAEADALVNPTIGNAADKVVYEAAASCLPVFAASPVFDSLLPRELRFPAGDAAALARRIREYGGGAAGLRELVVAEHSVEGWAARAVEAAAALRRRDGP